MNFADAPCLRNPHHFREYRHSHLEAIGSQYGGEEDASRLPDSLPRPDGWSLEVGKSVLSLLIKACC